MSLPWQRGSIGKNAICSIWWPIPENPPYKRKNLADIPYIRRVIAKFVQNLWESQKIRPLTESKPLIWLR